jgi:hypothetical protein
VLVEDRAPGGRSNVDAESRMPESLLSDGACGAVH